MKSHNGLIAMTLANHTRVRAFKRADHADTRSDEARWGPRAMTIEERADYIACAMIPSSIGGTVWTKVRDRALQQLREVAGETTP